MTDTSLMHETGHSKPVHWDNPEGWGGEGKINFQVTDLSATKVIIQS